ncbi:hypothetical protein DEO72_LG2g3645 [Vigna unguiculata]|uniref:Uncharacterized protein n=1 Tax=Vigna unguiculata TaxID=3917 RepID=A0A4D6L455_VIGUN|nr:hypothetical protein DEO72_LG2g3645 [Vigna unguiculata]
MSEVSEGSDFSVDRKLWLFDHFLMSNSKERRPTTKFPRILHWMEVKVGDYVIKRSVHRNMVVSDVAASVEELSNTFVKEGFEEFGRGTNMSDRKKQGCDEVEDNYYQWDESSVADIGEEKFSEIAQHKSGDIDEGVDIPIIVVIEVFPDSMKVLVVDILTT